MSEEEQTESLTDRVSRLVINRDLSELGRAHLVSSLVNAGADYSTFGNSGYVLDHALNTFRRHDMSDLGRQLAESLEKHRKVLGFISDDLEAARYAEEKGLVLDAARKYKAVFEAAIPEGEGRDNNLDLDRAAFAALGMARLTILEDVSGLVKTLGLGDIDYNPDKPYGSDETVGSIVGDPDIYLGNVMDELNRQDRPVAMLDLFKDRFEIRKNFSLLLLGTQLCDGVLSTQNLGSYRDCPVGAESLRRLSRLMDLRYGSIINNSPRQDSIETELDNPLTLAGQVNLAMQACVAISDGGVRDGFHGFVRRDESLYSASALAGVLGLNEKRRELIGEMRSSDELLPIGHAYAREGNTEKALEFYRKTLEYEGWPMRRAAIARDLLKDSDLAIECYEEAIASASAANALSQMQVPFNMVSSICEALNSALRDKRSALYEIIKLSVEKLAEELGEVQIIGEYGSAEYELSFAKNHFVSVARDIKTTSFMSQSRYVYRAARIAVDNGFGEDINDLFERRDKLLSLKELDLADDEQVEIYINTFVDAGLHDYAGVIAHLKARERADVRDLEGSRNYFHQAIDLFVQADWPLQAVVAAEDAGFNFIPFIKQGIDRLRKSDSLNSYRAAIRLAGEHGLIDLERDVCLEAIALAEEREEHSFAGFYAAKVGQLGRSMQSYWKLPANGDRDQGREYALQVFAVEFMDANDKPSLTFDGYFYGNFPIFDVVRERIVAEYGEREGRDEVTQQRMDEDRNNPDTVIGQVSLAIEYYLELGDNRVEIPQIGVEVQTCRFAGRLALEIEDEERAFTIWREHLSPIQAGVLIYRNGGQEEGLQLLEQRVESSTTADEYAHLGSAFKEIGNEERAEHYSRKAMDAYREEGDFFWYAIHARELGEQEAVIYGRVHDTKRDYDGDKFSKTVGLAEQHGFKNHLVDVCREAIPTLVDRGEFKRAKECAEHIGDERAVLYGNVLGVIKAVREDNRSGQETLGEEVWEDGFR